MSLLRPRIALTVAVAAALMAPAASAAPPTDTPEPAVHPAAVSRCYDGGDATVESSRNGERLHYLTGVRAAGHVCHDRVVFEFDTADPGGGPGFQAHYEPAPLREDGRGRQVDVAGEAFLVVRMSPARDVRLSSGRVEPTYRGPDSIRPAGTRHVVEVRHVGSFEGQVTWAVGLRERRPFQATVLDSPPRLVLDFP